jgi:hypothetical protein
MLAARMSCTGSSARCIGSKRRLDRQNRDDQQRDGLEQASHSDWNELSFFLFRVTVTIITFPRAPLHDNKNARVAR